MSGHSRRVGTTLDPVALRVGLSAVMQAGRWKTPNMPARYAEHLLPARGPVAQLRERRRRAGKRRAHQRFRGATAAVLRRPQPPERVVAARGRVHAGRLRKRRSKRARDGTLFEHLRRELAAVADTRGTELAHAAAYLDKIASLLSMPLPADLRAF